MHDQIGGTTASAKVVRVGILSSISKLDPREAVDNISGLVLAQIFEPPYPNLFEPLRNDGGLQYSATIRPAIRFSDGTPLTAELAARSLRSAKILESKAAVDVRGDRVVFTLAEANPRFDLTLTQGNTAIVLEKESQLLGTGAFQFDRAPKLPLLQAATRIRLVRNPHFHGSAAVDELHFVVLPADGQGVPALLVEALRSGDVDITTSLSMADLTTHRLSGLTPSMQPGNSTGILFFNCERAVLAKAEVRRGIAMAIDGYEIATKSFEKNPAAFVAPNLLPPMMGRVSGIRPADRAAARRLIDASATKPSRLTLLVPWAPRPYMPKPQPVANVIRRQLAEIGIAVAQVDTTTGEEFFGELASGNYDLALAGWIADTPDPADFFEALLWSKMCEGENHSNHSRWKDPATDAALARFRADPTDANKQAIHRLVQDQAPLVPLIYGQSTIVHARKLRNVTMTPTGVLSLAGVTI